MAAASLAALGAWEDTPRRNLEADVTRVGLSNREAFVLTRIDGFSTISEICAMSGLGESDALHCLSRLLDSELIVVESANGDRNPVTGAQVAVGGSAGWPARQSGSGASSPSGSGRAQASGPRRVAAPSSGGRRRAATGSLNREAGRPSTDSRSAESPSGASQRVPTGATRREIPSQRRSESRPPTGGLPELPSGPAPQAYFGVRSEDASFLARYGIGGMVPGTPFCPPGAGRYGRYEFDKRELLQRCDLSVEEKREILFLANNLHQVDHFEFFGIEETTSDRKAYRKAYFRLSKRFHPDTYNNRDVGNLAPSMELVYSHATTLYEVVSADEKLREIYKRAVDDRNAAYRARLEVERLRREEERQAQAKAAARTKAVRRKQRLAERLDRNIKTRRRTASNPVAERLLRAEQFYTDGMAQYEQGKFIAAASSLQLAVTYDPKNELYQQAHDKVAEKAKQVRAEQLWKRGYMQESVARLREALLFYHQAIEVYPRCDYCAHTAELLLDTGEDVREAARLAERAVREEPENVDYLLLLGKIYQEASLIKKALGTFERALSLDPKNAYAKKTLKVLKRM